ncbi:MAG: ATP-dependent Clp protease proteolytic subunit [Bacteroidota bacterium]
MEKKPSFLKYARDKGVPTTYVEDYMAHLEGMTRTVIEERPQPFREIDVFSRLIMDRIVFLGTQIDSEVGNIITAQLLFLERTNPEKDILLYVNSPGGEVYAGLSIYDTMQYIKCDVATIDTALAASMAAVILAGGAKGKRAALPHARVMVHQPLGSAQGQASDMERSIKEVLDVRKDLYKILSEHTDQPLEEIESMSDRDYWMQANEAQKKNFIDQVLERKRKDIKSPSGSP